jgi:CheY-like chemotaxis protein
LECAGEESDGVEQASQQPPSAFAGSLQALPDAHILLAEDCPVNQEVAAGMLEALGCRATVVGDGEQALQAISEQSFDLVLMDCQMPGLDGYQATRRIRDREMACATGRSGRAGQALPIVALTAHAMVGAREECLQAGMDDYLTKPFDLERLRCVLERWLIRSPKVEQTASRELDPRLDADSKTPAEAA